REGRLLHALSLARAKDSDRPKSAADVVSLNLSGTAATDVGLKELAGLKNLSSLGLYGGQVTDEALKVLCEVGLLYALTLASAKDGARPKSAADVVSLDLSITQVTDAGLKELVGLKKLNSLNLTAAQVTDKALKVLREVGLLYALIWARAKDGGRPNS